MDYGKRGRPPYGRNRELAGAGLIGTPYDPHGRRPFRVVHVASGLFVSEHSLRTAAAGVVERLSEETGEAHEVRS